MIMERIEASSSDFAKTTRKTLARMSPIALCAVFEQFKRGRSMSIKEVMEMESKMAWGFYQGDEFYEGLRGFVDR